MVTEIGFVSLLVAGFGGLAGGLIYLAARIFTGSAGERGRRVPDRSGPDRREPRRREREDGSA